MLTFSIFTSLLSSIGHHRRQHVEPSKGKRHRKRKRQNEKSQVLESEANPTPKSDQPKPPYPNIQKFLTIGFNSTNRHLESLARTPREKENGGTIQEAPSWMSAVFVPRSDQPSILNAHLPLLVRMASIRSPSKPPIRLVSLPKAAEQKLSTSLGTPRVGIVGLLDEAPAAEGLVRLVRELVAAVDVPWLQEATIGKYMPVNIKTIETSAPVVQKRKRPLGSKDKERA